MRLPRVFFIRLDCQEKALHIGRLAERHFHQGQRTLIIVANDEMATRLDRYLWTWNKGSFLPHAVQKSVSAPCDEAIVISTLEHHSGNAEVLICAVPCTAAFFRQFQIVYDFAETYDAHLAEAARERFRRCRQLGFDPQMESLQPEPGQTP